MVRRPSYLGLLAIRRQRSAPHHFCAKQLCADNINNFKRGPYRLAEEGSTRRQTLLSNAAHRVQVSGPQFLDVSRALPCIYHITPQYSHSHTSLQGEELGLMVS